MKKRYISLAAIMMLAGCDVTETDVSEPDVAIENPVEVSISNGNLQCQDNGLSLDTTKSYLTDAGIKVGKVSCGIENLDVIAACGAASNQIHIFTIDKTELDKSENLGFIDTSKLESGYREVDCDSI